MGKIRSLNSFLWVRAYANRLRKAWLRLRHGIVTHPTSSLSLSSRLLCHAPGAINVGEETLVAFKTLLMSHDASSGQSAPIVIGRRCFIGGGSTIMPGVTVGDESIVAAGAVVFADVPPRSIVAGNPARVIRSDIKVGRFGRLDGADDNSIRLWRAD